MNRPRARASSLRFPVLALGALAFAGAACDDAADGSGGAASSSSSTTASTTVTGSSTTSSTSNSASAGVGGSVSVPTFVAQLDPAKGELAEGLFVKDQTAYVGLAGLGKILKVALPGGAVSDLGTIPTPPMGAGFMLGIVVDAANDVFVGFGGGPGMVVANGIYKIPAAGGAVTTPFASNPEMNFPNGLWLDAAANAIFVADSGGAIFKVDKTTGATTKWFSDPLLVGTDLSCMYAAPFPIGANGIVRIGDTFVVANTNLGSLVKIAINGDGTAGAATNFVGPNCNALGGIDGIDVGPDGKTIIAVINSRNELVQIDSNGDVVGSVGGEPFDNPASVDVVGTNAYVTNSAFFNTTDPAPGVLVYALD